MLRCLRSAGGWLVRALGRIISRLAHGFMLEELEVIDWGIGGPIIIDRRILETIQALRQGERKSDALRKASDADTEPAPARP